MATGPNGLPNVAGLAPGATSATGDTNLRYLATPLDRLRAHAEANPYPRWVRKDGVKVLVADETDHRREVPADFDAPKTNAAELIEAIKGADDANYLHALLDGETRKGVLKAIEARLAQLAE